MSQDEIMGHVRRFPPSSQNFDSRGIPGNKSLESGLREEAGAPPATPGLAWGWGQGGGEPMWAARGTAGTPPSPGSPLGRGGGGARLPGMGDEVCRDLASASPSSRPQRRVWEDPRGSPKRVRVPDIYSLPGHQTCGPAHAPPGQDRGS